MEEEICCICLSEFKNKEIVKKLECGHFYHKSCIDSWIVSSTKNYTYFCPLCKYIHIRAPIVVKKKEDIFLAFVISYDRFLMIKI